MNDLLTQLTRIFFVLLAILTVADFLRHRDRIRRDVALEFTCLAATFLIQIFTAITGVQAQWLTKIGTLALIAQPYLLLRLVHYFRSVPSLLQSGALLGLIVSWAMLIVFTTPLPSLVTLVLIAYFVAIDGYAVYAFIQGAFSSAGVVRQRFRFVAAGSGLLVVALLIAGVGQFLRSMGTVLQPLILLGAVLSALSFYLGFAPPRWLRQAWQFAELQNYLLEYIQKSGNKTSNEILERLRLAVTRAIGASIAVIALWDKDNERLIPQKTSEAISLLDFDWKAESTVKQAWRDQKPTVLYKTTPLSSHAAHLMQALDAEMLLIIPIATNERTLGLLLVFLRHGSLFVDDDVNLLTIYTQQTAIVLENIAVLEELRHYTEDLEHKVQERTAELRASEAELRNLNVELEQRVVERTAQLTTVNRELEAFSYSVSHDLRAPLRAMNGFSLALVEDYADRLDEEGKKYLQRIQTASERMGQLIDDLLQLSRLTRSEIQIEQVNLSILANQITAELHERQPERQVQFDIEKDLIVNGDVRLLRVLLANLLENAWKFTGKQPEAQIAFGKTQHNGQQAYFVRDNGAGFDMAYADKLFGAFQRLHSEQEFKGIGIGLAIVQRVVHRHNGQIWVEAAVGEGATFYFTL